MLFYKLATKTMLMKTHIILLFLLIITSTVAISQLRYDTLLHETVGPGIIHTTITVTSKPWFINILEIDLLNPYNQIETVKAQDKLTGYEKTSAMASRKSWAGHMVAGAINADFFGSGGVPINVQAINGQLLRRPISYSVMGFTTNKLPYIEQVQYAGVLLTKSEFIAVNGINEPRGTNTVVMYNSYFGSTTGTNTYGTELRVLPLTKWIVNDTVTLVVTQKEKNSGNMSLKPNEAVLSANGTAQAFFDAQIEVNDTIKLVLQIKPGLNNTAQLLGGFPKIVYLGQNYAQQGYTNENGPSHTFELHPRTAAGFSKDSSKLYLFTVDGRQGASKGMTLPELADFMIISGVYTGINFDGGGSTTMVVRDQIVNKPSDGGGERSVANALLVLSTAPQGNLFKIKLNKNRVEIMRGTQTRFSISAWNQYMDPMEVDTTKITFTLSKPIGTMSTNGLFTPHASSDSAYVIASYLGITDSAAIIVYPVQKIKVTPEKVTIDTIRNFTFSVTGFDKSNTQYSINNHQISWKLIPTGIALVDDMGNFKALANGDIKVIAQIDNASDTIPVTIEQGTGYKVLSTFDSREQWKIEVLNMDYADIQVITSDIVQGEGAFKINYKYTYQNKTPSIFLATDFVLYGIPDSLWLYTRYDGGYHSVNFHLKTTSENLILSGLSLNHQKYTPIASKIIEKPIAHYPLKLNRIEIKFGPNANWVTGNVYEGAIYVDLLMASYPGHGIFTHIKDVSKPNLKVISYPNPFTNEITLCSNGLKPGTNAWIQIFDISGKLVYQQNAICGNGSLNFSWKAPAPGIYMYVLHNNNNQLTGKIICTQP